MMLKFGKFPPCLLAPIKTLTLWRSNKINQKGKSLVEEVEDVLTTLTSLVKRARELTALRLSKEKTLSEESTLLISDLQDALQEAHQDIDTLLSVAAPEEAEVETIEDDTELLLETERVLMETFDPEL